MVCKTTPSTQNTTSEKPVNDQSYGVLDRYGITILYKYNNYKRLKWFVKQHQVHKTQRLKNQSTINLTVCWIVTV